jgi:hypothetical protein
MSRTRRMSIKIEDCRPSLRARIEDALRPVTRTGENLVVGGAPGSATQDRDRPSISTDEAKLNKTERAFFSEVGVPCPVFEYRFHSKRKWRFDMAWPDQKVALEVQGGIFSQGRHTRGAALLKEWEKLNTAATLGWRILYCQPNDLLKRDTATMIFSALNP